MKSFMLTLPAYFFLLLVTGSCKKEVIDEPAPNLANCRIVREVYKSIQTTDNKDEIEKIEVDGRTVTIAKYWERRYTYDKEGRLYTAADFVSNIEGFRTQYTYQKGYIVASTTLRGATSQDTIYLNPQGLAIVNTDSVRYDENGFPVEFYFKEITVRKNTYVDDNLTTSRYTVLLEDITDKYIYNTSKLSLPNLHPYYGKLSKNLIIGYTQTVNNSKYYPVGLVFEKNYKYIFDKFGRVSRRLASSRRINPLWPFQADPGGVGITDFEYDCP
ncbi:hypothetical protein [Spirosoma montaniterrae]|uniref:DUF4595 domain-containing protein n=1 Tax=Spirosoma montaniterrae TaxID=1178516 RepID=A0A1P9WZS5_9BACT|nr:hypothetical protein [Spirosoma montaniterrae]AQG80886.1 hypothetical protein AWR27_17105 [Spirosoma montaniterrae]